MIPKELPKDYDTTKAKLYAIKLIDKHKDELERVHNKLAKMTKK